MLCAQCFSTLQNPKMKGWHHRDLHHLLRAAYQGCRICQKVCRRFRSNEYHTKRSLSLSYEMSYEPYQPYEHWELCITIQDTQSDAKLAVTIAIHVCKNALPPPNYRTFLDQVAADLGSEPWLVRRPPYWREDIPQSTGDGATANLANTWLRGCRNAHERCWEGERKRDTAWLPKRLILVGNELFGPRLIQPGEYAPELKMSYATLSHCWGQDSPFLVLKSMNMAELMLGIDELSLPQSFRQAIVTCRRLGIRYIWVDSLCIVQSGPGSEPDWLDHAENMHLIYKNCELNIAVDHARSPHEGAFVTRNTDSLQGCCVWTPLSIQQPWHAMDTGRRQQQLIDKLSRMPESEFTMLNVIGCDQYGVDAPLSRRGWVFQERLMSPRILHFTEDRIAWECSSTTFNEYLSYGTRCKCYCDRVPQLFNISDSISTNGLKTKGCWRDFVTEYSKRRLTYPTKDKLAAFASVSRSLAEILGLRYYAGLFGNDPTDLLWRSIDPDRSSSTEYRAPSWSWASVDGSIQFSQSWEEGVERASSWGPEVLCSIDSIDIELLNPNDPYGQVKAGSMLISTRLEPFETKLPIGDLREGSVLVGPEIMVVFDDSEKLRQCQRTQRLASSVYTDNVTDTELIMEAVPDLWLLRVLEYSPGLLLENAHPELFKGIDLYALIVQKIGENVYRRVGIYHHYYKQSVAEGPGDPYDRHSEERFWGVDVVHEWDNFEPMDHTETDNPLQTIRLI